MQRSHVLARSVFLVAAAAALLPGCGPAETTTSQPPPPEAKTGVVAPSKPMPPQRIPKNVNPNASNKGIKGKYAD
jgi:hypothetical protein